PEDYLSTHRIYYSTKENDFCQQTKLFILFENLFKLRQRRLAVCMVTDFVSFIYNLKNMF
ncbi:hypothetical protein, partial [Streptococcus pneumoniae]|uniref:hypothetical protein n=1 Tax=Streptococcus pneumoniae TaxID=1313 RepID=UPI002E7B99FC